MTYGRVAGGVVRHSGAVGRTEPLHPIGLDPRGADALRFFSFWRELPALLRH